MDWKKYVAIAAVFAVTAVFCGCGKKAAETDTAGAEKAELSERVAEETAQRRLPVRKTTAAPVATRPLRATPPGVDIVLTEGEMLVSDFENWPNNLGGEIGVYGALEPNWDDVVNVPYSWVYEPVTPGYDPANVHSGKQSFRLVNGLGLKPSETWGSFAMDLGPTTDLTVMPKKVESADVSGYGYLSFWVKGDSGREKMELLIRDSHALNYSPQVKYKLPDLTVEWQKIVIPLKEISSKVDLTQLDNIGIAFGKDVGNVQGEIAYIDDFVFTNNP